jgi:molybdopterin molybdotransferase
MGDSDFVKTALEEIGADILFERVAVKPGKPMCFAKLKHKTESRESFFFCCPGNPVSVLLSYHYFVRPALGKLMGHANAKPLKLSAVLNGDLRKKSGRRENLRGRLAFDKGTLIVTPVRGQGSHMLGGLATANCLIHFPLEADSLRAGATVEVEPLSLTY